MRLTRILAMAALALPGLPCTAAQTPSPQIVVFEQPGFPTVASEAIAHQTLIAALGPGTHFADIAQISSGNALQGTNLLVLPYGSAVPVAAWPAIQRFLRGGGNLLVLGGQPLRVPVLGAADGSFQQLAPQDSYSRLLDLRHTYPAPLAAQIQTEAHGQPLHFAWHPGYRFLPPLQLEPKEVFVEEGRLNGLGYLDTPDGTHLAAPVIVADHAPGLPGSRLVALLFHPAPGFWASPDGMELISACARYAASGTATLLLETQYAALRPGEPPVLNAYLTNRPKSAPNAGAVHFELRQNEKLLDGATVPLSSDNSAAAPFTKALPPGVYTVTATWTPSGSDIPAEFAENGFVVEDLSALQSGPAFGAHGDFLTLGDQPFLPVGTNYFSTEANGWNFAGPRNGAVWERDFADMQHHGVNFVRTGVWNGYGDILTHDPDGRSGGVTERFLRNLEGYLSAAQRHGVVVNFTFFAFSPRTGNTPTEQHGNSESTPPPPNPYLDLAAVASEQAYVRSVAHRFGKLPFLSWDLINEPSFANPRLIFHGNVPNNDPVELAAWHTWLVNRYPTLEQLADVWRVTPDQLGSFDKIPLPSPHDLTYDRYGNPDEVRAFDYNLFAQEMFAGWVHGMVDTLHHEGSTQPINVGQDEGGVTDRLLNQFYAASRNSGVTFTTNHTYWQDDALLWDSVAAKRPGLPNITGETGYQPAWNPDGTWRYHELTGLALEERKWALGFAAGSSGAVQWDWDREVDFGMQRSDGSAKLWEAMMRNLGAFAKAAAPHATALQPPEVALILPESLQLSVLNKISLEAQQNAVRTLYYRDRVEAYAVGSFATDTLGTPKLIILPSAYALNDKALHDIQAQVEAGATLLASGPFTADEHLHPTARAASFGLRYTLANLAERYEALQLPGGGPALPLDYTGLKITELDRAELSDDPTVANLREVKLGKGTVLFSALPLELNSNAESLAAVYAYALAKAGVARTYTTGEKDPGLLICPTRFPDSTLYVLTSETAAARTVSFRDNRSGQTFSGSLAPGRAALLLIGKNGKLLASYGWTQP